MIKADTSELMRKAHDDQTKLLKARELYVQNDLIERGKHTWYKLDSCAQMSGAALLGLLWYVSHARRIKALSNAGSSGSTHPDDPNRAYALVRTLSLAFASITLPVSFWRLVQGMYHDYTLQAELATFDGKLLDLENNIGFLMNEEPRPVVTEKPEAPKPVEKPKEDHKHKKPAK